MSVALSGILTTMDADFGSPVVNQNPFCFTLHGVDTNYQVLSIPPIYHDGLTAKLLTIPML